MERRFFFGALAGLGGLFTLGAAEQPKPVQARATKETPSDYWDVHAEKGYTGTIIDANGVKVEGMVVAANLVSGDVLKFKDTGYSKFVERHAAPLRFEATL